MDSDAVPKVEKNEAPPEFDDDHLREAEKNLTKEERWSRRQESLALKEKGNGRFKAAEHREAERSYTEALAVCPVCFSSDRAVLFSNRAAARIHLDLKDQAIADCSRAVELNPDYVRPILRRAELYEKTDKLDEALRDYKTVLEKEPGQNAAREACVRLPRQIHDRDEKMDQLHYKFINSVSTDKDLGQTSGFMTAASTGTRKTMEATMQEQIEGIEMFDSPTKGRGLRVTKPFKVGELIFSSPAYSYVLSVEKRGNYCDFCLAMKPEEEEDLKKCVKCKKAFYCNKNCQQGDWNMHKLECSAMVEYGPKWCPSERVRLVARILATKKAHKERSASEKLILMGELHSYVDNKRKLIYEADIADLHLFYSKHLDFPDHHDLLSLSSQAHGNGFALRDEYSDPNIGRVVYADVSLMNHSCVPSVVVTYKGTAAEIRATQDMKPGDEMLISYIDLTYPTEDRNYKLRLCCNFTCDCQECQTKSKDEAKLKVRERSDPIGPDEISDMVSFAKEAIERFESAIKSKKKNILTEWLDMCKQSLDKMRTVFDDSNVYMLIVMKHAMEACFDMDDWNGAIRYGEKIAQPLSELYPPNYLYMFTFYWRLAELYRNVQNSFMTKRYLKKVISIVEVNSGKDHPFLEKPRQYYQVYQMCCALEARARKCM